MHESSQPLRQTRPRSSSSSFPSRPASSDKKQPIREDSIRGASPNRESGLLVWICVAACMTASTKRSSSSFSQGFYSYSCCFDSGSYFSETCLKDECFEPRAFRSFPSLYTEKILIRRDGSSVNVIREKRQLGLLI